jgi:hypothetical protein
MSRTTTTTAILHHPRVVGHNATTEAPSTTHGALSSQIEQQDHHLSRSTMSGGERYPFAQRRAYLGHPQHRAEHPPQPPSLRTKTIPLPALANVPISVNPLLAYNPSKVTLEYDLRLPPITAHLPPTAKAHASHLDWKQQPALNPSTVGSMPIIVPGLERAVVVFPTTLDSAVITIGDVLVAVYRAVQESAFEHHGEFGARRAIEGRKNFPASGPVDRTANAFARTIEELDEDHWWAGLYPCHNERDIWILRTRRINPR